MFEEHSSSFSSPYLFNGKELDRETNLSYYGARYLDMKTSLWLSTDPKMEKYPNIGAYVYCLNNPINLIDPDGRSPLPPWKKFLQKYNDWLWRNVTTKIPNNNVMFFPFDARGYEIYSHWAIGTGTNVKYNEGHWGDYMRNNHYIEQGLKDVLVTNASIMKENNVSNAKVDSFTFKDGFEIENGYLTGYEMLHGTDKFKIVSGKAKYDKKSDTYTFDLKLQWKDRIDKNDRQGDSDIAKNFRSLNGNMPANYNIEINWSQKIKITTDDIKNYNENNITPEAENRRRR